MVCESCGVENGDQGAEVRMYMDAADAFPLCGECRPIPVTLTIENTYEDGYEASEVIETALPVPPDDEAERDDWESDYLLPHTGTGYGSTDPDTGKPRTRTLDCWSTVTVASANPKLNGYTAEIGG